MLASEKVKKMTRRASWNMKTKTSSFAPPTNHRSVDQPRWQVEATRTLENSQEWLEYKARTNKHGAISRIKSRLFATRNHRKEGIDLACWRKDHSASDPNFCLVIGFTPFQFTVDAAYFYGLLEKEI